MSQENLDRFYAEIDILKTRINSKLPFIWVFGAGAEEVKNIDNIDHELNPGHPKFRLYDGLSSCRAKFFQWILKNNRNINIIRIPEYYPEWVDFRTKYTNLVDFELDIISISYGAIIFSESVGSYVEIGMVACNPEIHKNILVVVPSRYVDDESFFTLGAIYKIQENQIDDRNKNVWALDNHLTHPINIDNTTALSNEFKEIDEHMWNIININNDSKILFSASNKSHTLLLLLDLIDLFPRNAKRFYSSALERFKVEIPKDEFNKMISLLKILCLIKERKSGNNEKLEISLKSYCPCVNYYNKGKNQFARSDFKIINQAE